MPGMKVGISSTFGYSRAGVIHSTSSGECALGCKLALDRQMSTHSSMALDGAWVCCWSL